MPRTVNHHPTWLGGEASDAELFIGVGGGDSDAIGMEVHVAGEGGQLEAVECFFGVGFPEEEEAAGDAAADAHQRAVGEPAEAEY